MDGNRRYLIFFLTFAAASIAVAVLFAGSEGLSHPAATVLAISRMEIGAPPLDFEFARTGQGSPGQWTVVQDATGFDGRVIEQSNADRTDYRFPLAIFRPVVAKDVEVSLRFKPVAGRIDQAGGIAIRVVDADNYYVVRANALEDNVRFYRVVKGRRELIEGINIKVAGNTWHMLGIKAEGERFIAVFDGKTVFTASDKSFSGAGKIALWTKADSITRFDHIAIDALSGKE